jgi:hypothetical protein
MLMQGKNTHSWVSMDKLIKTVITLEISFIITNKLIYKRANGDVSTDFDTIL